MAKEIVRIDEANIALVDEVLQSCDMVKIASQPMLTKAVTLASGIQALRSVLTDEIMNKVFMPLQSSPLGFLTDNDTRPKDWDEQKRGKWEKGYPMYVVRECLIQGFLMGLQPVNNEMNIIGKRAYAAKNGLARKVREFPGLTDLSITPSVPNMGEKGALVGMRAKWILNGTWDELVRDVDKRPDGSVVDTRFAIRVNYGMGPDAVIGKAERKMLKAIYERITGVSNIMQDGDVIDATGEDVTAGPAPAPAPPEQDGKRVSVSSKPKSNSQRDTKPEPKPEAKPTEKPAITTGEIRDLKRLVTERGLTVWVEICEQALTGDDTAKQQCADYIAANNLMADEPGSDG